MNNVKIPGLAIVFHLLKSSPITYEKMIIFKFFNQELFTGFQ